MQQTIIKRQISPKQAEALRVWNDKETEELLYGGGAYGGKSVLFSMIAIDMCLRYKGIRGAIGRESLTDLKKTSVLTFFDQCNRDGLKEGRDFEYNQSGNFIRFYESDSIIFLLDLGWYPSDPQYDRLGSYELTFAIIEEAQQVAKKAKDVLKSRIRYKLKQYGLIPKLGMSCNPSNTWIKTEFYNPFVERKLLKYKRFIPALATDNIFADENYIETLRRMPTFDRERLLYGNWNYDDDPSRMIEYDRITDLFSNTIVAEPLNNFIVCDAARMGSDYMTVSYWEGFVCKKIAGFKHKKTNEAVAILESWRTTYNVPKSFVMVDEAGVGGGIVDQGGYKGFVAARRAFNSNYLNLRAECSFFLADIVNRGKIRIETQNPDIQKWIIQDLEQIRRKDPDKDRRLAVISKDIVKERIGRSPDWGDNLMMRMWYEVSPRPSVSYL